MGLTTSNIPKSLTKLTKDCYGRLIVKDIVYLNLFTMHVIEGVYKEINTCNASIMAQKFYTIHLLKTFHFEVVYEKGFEYLNKLLKGYY